MGCLGCTGPGARDVRGAWDVQFLEQGMCGVPGVYRSWRKGYEGCMGCTGPGPRGVTVRVAWGVHVLKECEGCSGGVQAKMHWHMVPVWAGAVVRGHGIEQVSMVTQSWYKATYVHLWLSQHA